MRVISIIRIMGWGQLCDFPKKPKAVNRTTNPKTLTTLVTFKGAARKSFPVQWLCRMIIA